MTRSFAMLGVHHCAPGYRVETGGGIVLVRDWSRLIVYGALHMVRLPVVDDAERQRLRDSLKQYKKRHGNLGDSKLYGRMYYVLDPQHHVYLSQSTMQRFIRNKGRTTDEAVQAIKTFLDRVSPTSKAHNLAKAFADVLVVPIATIPPVFQPVETYQGRYELYRGLIPASFLIRNSPRHIPQSSYCFHLTIRVICRFGGIIPKIRCPYHLSKFSCAAARFSFF